MSALLTIARVEIGPEFSGWGAKSIPVSPTPKAKGDLRLDAIVH